MNFSEKVAAYHDVWLVGDDFLRECYTSLQTMNLRKSSRTFLHKNFNISAHYASLAVRGVNRMIYPFVDALNERYKIPRYIIIIPDKDMISHMKANKFSTAIVMGSTIHYIIKQYDILLDHHRLNLTDKRIGAVVPDGFPSIIWVRMLKRPAIDGHTSTTTPFSLRGKFNSILVE